MRIFVGGESHLSEYLFNYSIASWSDWGRVFNSPDAFAPLAEYIFDRERLDYTPPEKLTPGTNAVFRIGRYVVKIYAPIESGVDCVSDMSTELFAERFAREHDVPTPRIVASGEVSDRYRFVYIVSEYIDGIDFDSYIHDHPEKKRGLAASLRELTDRMNQPAPDFNSVDIINDPERSRRWDCYTESFRADRRAYIDRLDTSARVFVHGDLNADNILVDRDGNLRVIDFADAVKAPKFYEQALIATELFKFDPDLISSYFGDMSPESLAKTIVDGLLIHDFGGDIIRQRIAPQSELESVDDLYTHILLKLKQP